MIVFGIRLFGKSEIVPGVFFICTRFFHICFVPLIPIQSCVIVANAAADQGVALPRLHWGSVSMAYLRGLLFLGALVLAYLAWGKAEAHAPMTAWRPMVLMALGCAAGFFGSYRVARAGPERLDALRQIDGLPSELLARAKQHFTSGA